MQQLRFWEAPVARLDAPLVAPARRPDLDAGADAPRSAPSHPIRPAASPIAPATAAPAADLAGPPTVRVEFVRHPRARRYLIRVRLDGSVRVTIPSRGSKREATAFYEQQRDWVASHQRRVADVRSQLPQDLPEAEQRALRSRATRELPARLYELASAAGMSVRKVSVRNQRHRWGSCSASGLICLNWRLVTMPDWIRDYVLYHELMHLKRMDHSPQFWTLVEAVCPNYRAARRWLRRHALAPHSAAAHEDDSRCADRDDAFGEGPDVCEGPALGHESIGVSGACVDT